MQIRLERTERALRSVLFFLSSEQVHGASSLDAGRLRHTSEPTAFSANLTITDRTWNVASQFNLLCINKIQFQNSKQPCKWNCDRVKDVEPPIQVLTFAPVAKPENSVDEWCHCPSEYSG